MVEFIKIFDQIPHKLNFGHLFSSPAKLYEDLLIMTLLIMAFCTVLL